MCNVSIFIVLSCQLHELPGLCVMAFRVISVNENEFVRICFSPHCSYISSDHLTFRCGWSPSAARQDKRLTCQLILTLSVDLGTFRKTSYHNGQWNTYDQHICEKTHVAPRLNKASYYIRFCRSTEAADQ